MQRSARMLLLLVLAATLSGCAGAAPQVTPAIGAVNAVNAGNTEGFARAVTARPFTFPADHGPHPAFQTEWWYLTGNLTDGNGRRFGYQLTFFRRAMSATPVERASAWGADQLYMAHFAVSDLSGGQFFAAERFSRAALGLAGAASAPLEVFLQDWRMRAVDAAGDSWQLSAQDGPVAIDLTVTSARPPVLQGDAGLSQKGSVAGNASYYYSLTRMVTDGTLTIDGERFTVSGLSWLDREWGTSALEAGVAGWDWFALHLDSGHDLMYFQLRNQDGSPAGYTGGSLLAPDGTLVELNGTTTTLTPLEWWTSPRSGGRYPSAWRLTVAEYGIDVTLRAALADQELPTSIVYWEGSIDVSGTHTGRGYMELTGYAEADAGRFVR